VTRRIRLPSGDALLTDTVGFIQKLPTQLVAAFRATLEELADADVLVHLVDITHPEAEEQYATVERTLEELGLSEKLKVVAFNKIDLMAPQDGNAIAEVESGLRHEHPEAVLISAAKRWNLDGLLSVIDDALSAGGNGQHTVSQGGRDPNYLP
jgi:GTP-binding protein HflX